MPHAVFNLGTQTASADLAARPLIPGVEPGGSRVGQATKPALLIRDAWIEIIDWARSSNADYHQATFYLKLSQELDLTPGLLLPVATVHSNMINASVGNTDQPLTGTPVMIHSLFHAQGTVWAPRVVGVRMVEVGTVDIDADLHLDYESVDVPWMDWFIMWEFLDGIADNERQY